VSRAVAVAVVVLAAAGCEGVLPEFDWQQMIDQHKGKPFGASSLFPDGRVMQPPPAYTVSRDRWLGRPDLTEGVVDGRYVERSPVPLTASLLVTGRFAFETYCAACHGMDGSGQSVVAVHMEQRKPPSLVDGRVRDFPDGRIFQVATRGYGLMPTYELELSVRERWAVVAYLRALQLSRAVPLDALPPQMRAAAERGIAAGARP
jgi:mono/diheme cytochrome c family protein